MEGDSAGTLYDLGFKHDGQRVKLFRREVVAKVLVFHFTREGRLPKLSKEELRDILRRFLEVLKDYPNVTFHETYVNEEGVGICHWEAPNAEVVRETVATIPWQQPHRGPMGKPRIQRCPSQGLG